MQTILARAISIIFHPLITPPLGMLLIFHSGTYLEFLSYPQKKAIFLILFTGTTILPLSLAPVMILQNIITDIKMENHRERVVPLLITTLFYAFTWFIMVRLNAPDLITIYTITAGLAVLFCALISMKWKISLHMTALGALAGVLLAIAFRFDVNLQLYLKLVFMAGGLVGWARLSLKAHTPAQIYAGYAGGLALAFFMMYSF